MGCSNCGSDLPCGCNQQVQTGVGRTCVDPCAAPSGCDPNSCCQPSLPASPIPFYACVPSCPESHTQTLVQQQFYFDISAVNTWNVPTCGNTAVLAVPGIKSINIGSYIWDAEFGYFEVTAFDVTTGQITILNHCNEGNAAAGTNVPACTLFTVTDPPPPDTPTSDSCVAIDFTAPPVCPDAGCCINITLTNLGSISAGDAVQIGTGRYSVDAIVSSEIITICNDLGLGLTPGTPVIAQDSAGNYQYCITIAQSCCSQIEAEFPDGLTPCSDFENDTSSQTTIGVASSPTIAFGGGTADSNVARVSIVNESTCRSMMALVSVVAHAAAMALASTLNVTYQLKESLDGGAYATVSTGTFVITGATNSIPLDVPYNVTELANPGVTHTLDYKVTLINDSIGTDLTVIDLQIRVSFLGVAV